MDDIFGLEDPYFSKLIYVWFEKRFQVGVIKDRGIYYDDFKLLILVSYVRHVISAVAKLAKPARVGRLQCIAFTSSRFTGVE